MFSSYSSLIRRWSLSAIVGALVIAVVTLIALASLLIGHEPAQAQSGGPTVTGVEVTSDAGSDGTYLLGETIRVTLTFSESVDVTGTPRLKIDMDPADWGEKWASYASGSGTASLTFTHTVVEPNYSTQGIAVLENTLELNGGTIRSVSSQTDADLSHTELAHNASHKVDWHRSPPAPTPEPTPTPISTPEPTPPQAPSVTGVSVTSNAGDDDTYLLGETIRVTLTFSESVDVTGTPRLKIDMDPADWGEKWASYASGSGTTSLTFTHTVVEPNLSTQGIAVLENTLELNGGSIKSASSQAYADLSHTGLAHDASHKVDWRQSPPTPTPAATPGPTPTPAPTQAPSVTDVSVTSNAGDDDTYVLGETIRVTLTFSETVNVTGTPRLKIDMDPAEWGEKWASYESDSGTTSLTFSHTVVEPNISTQGIAVLENTLELKNGSIKSAATQTDADLSHTGLAHDASHKVDWRQSPQSASAPTVTGVEVSSDAGSDNTYAMNEVIQVTLTFSEAVRVTGAKVSGVRPHGGPELMIDMGPGGRDETWAKYQSGSGTASLTFAHSIEWPDQSTQGIAVLANTLTLNGGSIKSAATQADVALVHAGLAHDASHKADWQQSPQSAVAPTVTSLVIASHARNDNTYALGEIIMVRLEFNEGVRVTGAPRLKIDLDPSDGDEVWAVHSGSSLSYQYFSYTVVDPNLSAQGVAVLADTLELNGGTIRSNASQTDADLSHGGLDHDANHKVDGIKKVPEKKGPGNDAPVCTGSAKKSEAKYAPPLHLARHLGLDCGDADGDELTFTVSSDPPGVAKQMWYDSSINRVYFQALGHCDLEKVVPPPPYTFTTTVTVTATDPHGASATGRAYFKTWYARTVNNMLTGCPNLVSAVVSGKVLTLTFNVWLDEDSVPAPGDFVVKADGEAVALAETGAVRIKGYSSVVLILAEAASGSQAMTVSYTPGDNPIGNYPLFEVAHAEAFEDYPVKYVEGPPSVTSVTLVSVPSVDTDDDGVNDTYKSDDVVRARVTFDKAVDVVGRPVLRLKLDRGWGPRLMYFDASGGRTNITVLEFTYRVNVSVVAARGIAFDADTLILGWNTFERFWDTIRAAGSSVNADLRFASVPHDPAHKVDGTLPTSH